MKTRWLWTAGLLASAAALAGCSASHSGNADASHGTSALVSQGASSAPAPSATPAPLPADHLAQVNPDFMSGLRWRLIGPFRGGRVPAVAGDVKNPLIYYMGTEGGGVWKTYDAGEFWQNVSDHYFTSASIGAIAVSPSNPNIVYVGSGEATQHDDIQGGDGVYKTTNGGETWVNVGLRKTYHIGSVVVDPKNPNIVYVAALGHEYSSNPQRGIYRSEDGGKTWKKVLYVNSHVGGIDLSMDPANPQVVYAAMWQFVRKPWSETSGGPGSGLYKTTDGGNRWTNISHNPGMPTGILGKIGVSVCHSEPNRLYAVIEAKHGGLYRSDNSGATWKLMNDNQSFLYMIYWYAHVLCDPVHPDTVYIPQVTFWKSTDGGHTIHAVPLMHVDNHALWINPNNDNDIVEGNDGGAVVSLNGGQSWSSQMNQPTQEFFKISVDNQFPYRVYGTPMDNGAISCPSQTLGVAIKWKDCHSAGSSESGFIFSKPDDTNLMVAGAIGSSEGGGGNMYSYNLATGQQRMITVWPEDQYQSPEIDVKYRFAFTLPVIFSPHKPYPLYSGAQYVFRSTNLGTSWKRISPDLTTNDPKKLMMHVDGPITSQKLSGQYIGTIDSLAVSPLKKGEIWAGTDNRRVWYTPNGGKTWLNRSPKNLPEWAAVYQISPSPFEPGTIYIAANAHEISDHKPYFDMTTDYGKTWHLIDDGIPDNQYGWTIREDPVRPGLLYAGTNRGVFVSFDNGGHWQSLQRNLPVVAVRDLVVKNDDLVAGTHGRAIWILDGLHVLRELDATVVNAPVHLFSVPVTYRNMASLFHFGSRFETPRIMGFGKPGPGYVERMDNGIGLHMTRQADGSMEATFLNAGTNPPRGVVVTYYLKQRPSGPVTLTFMDSKGRVIKTFSGDSSARFGSEPSAEPGTNRFVWNLTYPNAKMLPQKIFAGEARAFAKPAVAVPGTYKVRLTVGGKSYAQDFVVKEDPRVHVSQQALVDQFNLIMKIDAAINRDTDAAHQIHAARAQLAVLVKHAQGNQAVETKASKLDTELFNLGSQLQRRVNPAHPMFVGPKTVNMRLAELTTVVGSADAIPTQQSYAVFKHLSGQLNETLTKLHPLLTQELPALLKTCPEACGGGK